MTLPELDTSNIGWIAYWNFLDNGGTSIDPMEAASGFNTYTEYSNAIEGTLDLTFSKADTRVIQGRVKDDGWFVVWMDRSYGGDFTQESNGGDMSHGPHDLIYNWDVDSTPDISASTLGRRLNSLYQNLSNSAEATWNYSDVGIYNYGLSGATTVSMPYRQYGSDGSVTMTVQPASSVEIHQAYAFAASYYVWTDWAANQESIRLTDGYSDNEAGVREVNDKGEITPGEAVDIDMGASGGATNGTAGVLLTWS